MILKMSGLGSKMAAGPGHQAPPRNLGAQPPLASLPSCCPGSAATLLPRPDIFGIIMKYV